MAAAMASACGGGNATSGDGSVAEVAFTASDGSSHTLAEMEGTPVVLNMWATWCKPCVKEMPAFDEVAAGTDAVRIIGVNVADEAADAEAFAQELGVSYEQYTDPSGELSDAFEVTGLPATAFIDADGNVVNVHAGALTADELRDAIAEHFPDVSNGSTNP
jgi:cytochrome c biogenesis protein CcmG, thiol:disulfide interchange protein DsbE